MVAAVLAALLAPGARASPVHRPGDRVTAHITAGAGTPHAPLRVTLHGVPTSASSSSSSSSLTELELVEDAALFSGRHTHTVVREDGAVVAVDLAAHRWYTGSVAGRPGSNVRVATFIVDHDDTVRRTTTKKEGGGLQRE